MSEWISIDNVLPEAVRFGDISKFVLIYYEIDREIVVACRRKANGGDWYWMGSNNDVYSKYRVSHWMPLPEPPTGSN